MNVSYVTPFYNGECEGRLGRFHDWVHALRDMDPPPFQFRIHPFMTTNPDSALASDPSTYLGEGSKLWGTKRNNIEKMLKLPKIIRELKNKSPDIIHMVSFDAIITLPILSANIDSQFVIGPNIAGWYPNRNSDLLHQDEVAKWNLWCKYLIRKQIVRTNDYSKAIVLSEYHRNMLKYLGFEDENIAVIPPGISSIFTVSPEKNNHPNGGVPELLYVGSLSKQKGYLLLLQAISKMDTGVHLRVIGSGDPNYDLIQSLGITGSVTIEGFVDRIDLPQYYQSADLFVIPSIDEMSPNTQFEALACGTPIVATDTPGINEFVPPEASQFFWPRDADTLASSLQTAIDHLDSLSKAADTHASDFKAEKTVMQLNQIYQSVLSN